jgi:phosphoribosylformimino-5-aminoimidazole carboxamide ribotide isomerase
MASFTVIPAIDLKGGQCVRLTQGRADQSKVYSSDPVAMARHWDAQGGRYLHVVDLDGAFQGKPMHLEVVRRIVAAVSMPVEMGGGLRTDEDIQKVMDCGVSRAIIGTRALADPTVLENLASRFGERLAVGIDARNGRVQVKGWVETTDLQALELARRAEQAGIQTLIYTDTATDGMLKGPNLAAVREMCEGVRCDVVASGGVSSVADVKALASLGLVNLSGAIVGKALYEGTVTLPELNASVRS